MFLSSMTPEEFRAEAYQDFLEMRTKIELDFSSFRKKLFGSNKRSFLHNIVETKTYRTKHHNTWNIRYQDCGHTPEGLMYAYCLIYTSFITKDNRTNYLIINNLDHFILEVLTAHFIQRYKERYLEPNHIDLRGMPLPAYFLLKNMDKKLTSYVPKGWKEEDIKNKCIWISNQGLIVSIFESNTFKYITFLDQENLSHYKSFIYEEELLMRDFNRLGEIIENKKQLMRDKGLQEIEIMAEKQSIFNKLFRTPDSRRIAERYFRRITKKDENYEENIQDFMKSWDEMEKYTDELEEEYKHHEYTKVSKDKKIQEILKR